MLICKVIYIECLVMLGMVVTLIHYVLLTSIGLDKTNNLKRSVITIYKNIYILHRRCSSEGR